MVNGASNGERAASEDVDGEIRVDYLRHVVIRFIIEPLIVKKSLVPVIATMLCFSPDERKLCETAVAKAEEQSATWLGAALAWSSSS